MNKPDIRFNGFNEEWTEKKLGDICEFSKGHGYSKKDLTSEGTPVYLYGQMYTNYKTSLVTSDIFVQPQSGSVYSTGKEVILPASGETPEDIARATAVLSEGIILGGDLNIVIPPKDLSQLFLALSISYEKNRNKLAEQAQGATITHLHNSDIAKLSIKYPESAEQKKLGALFSQIDSLIASTQKEHDKLVSLKKCMLQKMFPKKGSLIPEIRFEGFSGDWVEKKLGECITVSRGGSPRPIENYITTDEDGLNWVKIGDVEKNSRYIVQTAEKIKPSGLAYTRQVFVNDLILSNSMSFGRPYIMKIEGCIHDGWLLLRDEKKSFDLEFLVQLLSTDGMLEQYKALAAGGVVNNLNSELVQSTTLMFPSFEEQQKIGSYFQNLDNLISKQSAELEKLKNVKKTLLSKMFV